MVASHNQNCGDAKEENLSIDVTKVGSTLLYVEFTEHSQFLQNLTLTVPKTVRGAAGVIKNPCVL